MAQKSEWIGNSNSQSILSNKCTLKQENQFTFKEVGRFFEFTLVMKLALSVSSSKFFNMRRSSSTSATYE